MTLQITTIEGNIHKLRQCLAISGLLTGDNHPFWTVHLPHEVMYQQSVYQVNVVFWAQKWVSEPFSAIGDVTVKGSETHFCAQFRLRP